MLQRPHSRLDYLVKELSETLGAANPFVSYLSRFVDFASRVVKLRDGQEHSTTTADRLCVDNFRMMPTNQVRTPVWFLEGEEPQNIHANMSAIAGYLIDLVEGVFVGGVDQNLPDGFPRMCFVSVEHPAPEAPIRYQLVIDMAQFAAIPPVPGDGPTTLG